MKAIEFLSLPLSQEARDIFKSGLDIDSPDYDDVNDPSICLDEGLCEHTNFAYVGRDTESDNPNVGNWYICWPIDEEKLETDIDECVNEICEALEYANLVNATPDLKNHVKKLIKDVDIVNYWK